MQSRKASRGRSRTALVATLPSGDSGQPCLCDAFPACPQSSKKKSFKLIFKQRRMLSAGRQGYLALCHAKGGLKCKEMVQH